MNNYFLSFTQVGDTGKTKIFNVCPVSGNPLLGQVKWYAPWRKYCFYPSPVCVFDTGCLQLIADFCKDQNKIYKEEKC